MKRNAKIKENARKSLVNRWGKAIALFLFLLAVQLLFVWLEDLMFYLAKASQKDSLLQIDLFYSKISVSPLFVGISAFFALLTFFVLTPLQLGEKKWYVGLIRGEKPNLVTVFEFFLTAKTFFRALWLRILVGAQMLFAGILFALPSIGIYLGNRYLQQYSSSWAAIAQVGFVLLFVLTGLVMALLFWWHIQRYFLAEYYLICDEKISAWRAVRASVQATRGNRRQIFLLKLSFLPWMLLSVFLVPILFTAPYYKSALAINAYYLIQKQRVAEQTTEYIPIKKER